MYCGHEMRQRDRVSTCSRYGTANKLDMGWGKAGERQKFTSVRLAYIALLCAIPIMRPPPCLWFKDTFSSLLVLSCLQQNGIIFPGRHVMG